MTVERLEAEAMKLPLRERALLAQRLLASLDEDEIEQAWEDVPSEVEEGLLGDVLKNAWLEDVDTGVGKGAYSFSGVGLLLET